MFRFSEVSTANAFLMSCGCAAQVQRQDSSDFAAWCCGCQQQTHDSGLRTSQAFSKKQLTLNHRAVTRSPRSKRCYMSGSPHQRDEIATTCTTTTLEKVRRSTVTRERKTLRWVERGGRRGVGVWGRMMTPKPQQLATDEPASCGLWHQKHQNGIVTIQECRHQG